MPLLVAPTTLLEISCHGSFMDKLASDQDIHAHCLHSEYSDKYSLAFCPAMT